MGSNLRWRPSNSGWNSLSREFKLKIREWKGNGHIALTLDGSDIDVLMGMAIGGIKEAQVLIDAIEQYNQIDLEEHY